MLMGGVPSGGRRPRATHFEFAPGDGDERRCMVWVDAVEELVVRVAQAAGLGTGEASDFGLAVREALVNALRHGLHSVRRRVRIGLLLARGPALVVSVRDHGPGFDPSALPDPRSPENLPRSGGRGVFYMQQFADRVTFAFPKRGGTVTRLVKRLPADLGAGTDPGLAEWLGVPVEAGTQGS